MGEAGTEAEVEVRTVGAPEEGVVGLFGED